MVQCHVVVLFLLIHTLSPALAGPPRPPFACQVSDPKTKTLGFCKTNLPTHKRARDLVSRLTLDEKISQLGNNAPGIPRLWVPAYQWWSEALHGVSNVGLGVFLNGSIGAATSFPQVILTAASFEPYLWYRIAQAVGREARALYNAGQTVGMTFWTPNINIFRDPRWGRGQETPGEDPLLTGKYSVAYVRGLQGEGFRGGGMPHGHLQASACCKHFTAYDLDRWHGVTRYVFDAQVTEQDMADTFQPPFKSCVMEGKASGIMCAYNRVNGVPNCANFNLLTGIARRQWKFHGYITSDCDAVSIIYEDQRSVKSPEDAVANVLKAGMDVNCGSYVQKHARSATEKKKLSEADIDRALHNLFSVRMRLGLFDGDPKGNPFGNIGPREACSPSHQTLALDAARNGIVMLKNSNQRLPLSKHDTASLAVIGPNAASTEVLKGNYAGKSCKSVSPLDALRRYVKSVVYQPGCKDVACASPNIEQAVKLTRKADQVVLIMGLDQTQEKEELDRDNLALPGRQRELITSVAKAAKRPVVLVLLCGGPVDVSFAKTDDMIGSIIWAGYPGEAGGIALAEIIFGDHNPGGRLPMTWYPQSFTKVAMTDMRMRPDASSGYPGRTYRFYKGPKVYEFGYGLSYSNYSYQFKSVSPTNFYLNQSTKAMPVVLDSESSRFTSISDMGKDMCSEKKLRVHVGVHNHGMMAGKHPVLMFVSHEKQGEDGRPVKQLAGFKSVAVSAGEEVEMEFEVNICEHFSRANEKGIMVVENGSYNLVVGDAEYPVSIAV